MPSPKIPCKCSVCGKEFLSDAANFKRCIKGHFCSRKCYYLRNGSPVERFWNRTKKTENCWIWTGFRDGDGYGVCGRRSEEFRENRAHRFSWELHYGPIPSGLFVLHHCDTPPCVRPDHLFLGTPKDNADDMVSKLRHVHGVKISWARFSAEQIREIRQLESPDVKELAKIYGVVPSIIKNILHRKTYRYVE